MPALPEQIDETIQIENVVTSADIECDLDLAALHKDLDQSQYNVEQFPGLIYRCTDPKVTVLVFRSGKIVCTGSRSFTSSKNALDDLLSEFDALGLEYADPELTIQNIVGVANLGDMLNLNAIAIGFGLEKTEYEPEQFPGLVYRMEHEPAVALIFGSGKMVITGGKQTGDVQSAVEHVYQELQEYSLI